MKLRKFENRMVSINIPTLLVLRGKKRVEKSKEWYYFNLVAEFLNNKLHELKIRKYKVTQEFNKKILHNIKDK